MKTFSAVVVTERRNDTDQTVANQNWLERASTTQNDLQTTQMRIKLSPLPCRWSVTMIGIQWLWIACYFYLT